MVYNRARTRENRKATPAWDCMGDWYRPINIRKMELRIRVHWKFCERSNNKLYHKYMTKADIDHPNFVGRVLCSKGIGAGYTKREDANNHKYTKGKTNETYRLRNGAKINLPIYYRSK